MKIKIDGEEYEVDKVRNGGYLPNIDIGQMDFYVAASSEDAGKAARKYWEDIRDHDKKEFVCLIGEKRLVQWACGESDSFGLSSFEDFLDVVEGVPEEEFASYDGVECEVDIDVDEDDPNYAEYQELIEELGFVPTVAYRHN
jgi:hypothetical protein